MPQITPSQYLNMLFQSTGDTWVSEASLRSSIKRRTGSDTLAMFNAPVQNGLIRVGNFRNERWLTISTFYEAEKISAENIVRIRGARHKLYPEELIDQKIQEASDRKGLKLDIGQINAVKKAVNSMFMVLTGGPGTGKTCVLNIINDVLKLLDPNLMILYTAPTGKAARRITESTGCPAQTLHSCLKITADHMEPELLQQAYGVLVVDEVSMLDIEVANALFKAVRTGQRLYLVGDTDQLPSVGPGAVLRDLIASGVVPTARLTKTFRQAGDSILFDNIQRIKAGTPELHTGDDFKLISAENTPASAQKLMLMSYKRMARKYGVSNMLCLTPMRRKGETSSNVMNALIQRMVNPYGDAVPIKSEDGDFLLRKNDIVMQLKNRELVANGDVGIVKEICKDRTGRLVGIIVDFMGITVDYMAENIPGQLTLAYAMSIHKSQGSEARGVVTAALNEHNIMLQRNLIYTAVTRAKKECYVVFEKEAVKKALENESSCQRHTMLQEFLKAQKTA